MSRTILGWTPSQIAAALERHLNYQREFRLPPHMVEAVIELQAWWGERFLSPPPDQETPMNMAQSNDPIEALTMETYQSIKLVGGKPMSRAEFHQHREAMRLQVGDDFVTKHYALLAHGTDEPGYLVKCLDGPYFSWSPKDVFENGHVKASLKPGAGGLRFGQAQICLERGQKVARTGWNGKGMWLEFVPGHGQDLPFYRMHYPVGSAAYPEGARVPWLASQTDILARDWEVVCG